MLDNIPDGAQCFVDANVIAYYLLNVAPFAQRCEGFFKRVENRVLLASTSAAVIAEATHKVMLAEAIEQHGLGHQALPTGSSGGAI
jgi:predicted nucleic acid-binding protein